MREGISLTIPAYKSSSWWKKFVHRSKRQPVSKSAITVVPSANTTTEGPLVLKPAPLPEDYEARIEAFLSFLDYLESKPETIGDVTTEQ